jgi:hypothetical protein
MNDGSEGASQWPSRGFGTCEGYGSHQQRQISRMRLEELSTRTSFFNDLQARGERLRPPKSCTTVSFVDPIVERQLPPRHSWSANYVAATIAHLKRSESLWPSASHATVHAQDVSFGLVARSVLLARCI